MPKQKQPLIPVTGDAAPPKAHGPSVADWVTEGRARIRRMTADHVFLGGLIDQLFSEIVKRDEIINKKPE